MNPDRLFDGKTPKSSQPAEESGQPAESFLAQPDLPESQQEKTLDSSALKQAPSIAEGKSPTLFALDQLEYSLPKFGDQSSKKNAWIITFADLMNLLLCFFVLLFSSSRIDLEKFRLIAQSMSGALDGKTVIYVPIPAEDISKIPLEKETDMTGRLRRTVVHANQLRAILDPEIQHEQLAIEISDQTIIILIMQNDIFENGSSILNPNFLPVAQKIRDALVDVPGEITVAGYCDKQPLSDGIRRSNWQLSGARAFSLIQELLRDKILPEERFVLKGYGDTQPLLPNTSQTNRVKNRLIEIIIDQRGIKDNPDVIFSAT